MTDRPRLAIDAVGGDAGSRPAVDAALRLADAHEVTLVGPRRAVEIALAERGRRGDVEILDAGDSVGMDEDPVTVTRVKRRSSLMVAAAALGTGRVDAMVTAGNTGAAVLAAAVRVRRVRGVLNPALATLLPAPGATPTVFLDIGATTVCPPAWLAQFGVLGQVYARTRLGLAVPRIGLLSNGSEPVKGGPARRHAHALLSALPGYVGQVEAYDLLTGGVDVVVCDGFTGDVALKTYERTLDATADVALAAVRETLGLTAAKPVSAAVSRALRARLAAEPGGVLLGVRGVCVICHGAADADDITRAGAIAAACVERGVTEAVSDAFGGAPALRAPGTLQAPGALRAPIVVQAPSATNGAAALAATVVAADAYALSIASATEASSRGV